MAGNEEGFGIVYRHIMRDPRLSAEAKAIYAYLCSFANSEGRCFPGADLMASELNMGKDRFYKHLKALMELGIVTKEKERSGSRWGRTIYTVGHGAPYQLPDFEDPENEDPENQDPENEDPEAEDPENKAYNNNSSNSNSLNSTSIKNLCVFVCQLINQEKARISAKGRLREETGMRYLEELLSEGLTDREIRTAAESLGKIPKDYQWYSFCDDCRKKKALDLL